MITKVFILYTITFKIINGQENIDYSLPLMNSILSIEIMMKFLHCKRIII